LVLAELEFEALKTHASSRDSQSWEIRLGLPGITAKVMKIQRGRYSILQQVSVFLICLFILSGCAAGRYQAPVGTFRDKTQQTISVLSDFYSSRNSYEIDLYLQGVAADSGLRVEKVDANGIPTPLGKPIFSPRSIKARLDALNLVGAYGGRLSDLANSGAPTKFQSAGTLLGKNLSSLDKTFQTLEGSSDPTANKYIGPIGSLIGTFGQMFLDRRRDELISKAIADGAPQVDIILSQMRDDMDQVLSIEIITGSNERLATLITAYNTERGKLTYEQRTARLAAIKAAAAEAAASAGSAPSNLVTAMMDAHKALVEAVSPSKKPSINSFATLNSALEQWTNQIQSLASQIRLIIH